MRTMRVNSVFEAIERAEALKGAGAYDLFRGQPRDWRPLRASLARKSADERERAIERIARFAAWADTVPEMAHGANDKDELLGIAQHYGIPTNYMDFTTEPRIAGFFAADALPDDLREDESSCIICVNSRDLSEFWKSIQIARPEWPEPRVIRVNVPELWRLQAQRGCFVFIPYGEFEQIYDFDRIYFPPHRGEAPVPRDDVYPQQKSNLEIGIDRFFMLERMAWNSRLLEACEVVSMEALPEGIEKECFGPEGLPRHRSWADDRLACWAEPAAESWVEYSKAPMWNVELPAVEHPLEQVNALADTLLQRLQQEPEIRRGPVVWRCEGASGAEERLRLFWDGLDGGRMASTTSHTGWHSRPCSRRSLGGRMKVRTTATSLTHLRSAAWAARALRSRSGCQTAATRVVTQGGTNWRKRCATTSPGGSARVGGRRYAPSAT
ncbi:MAG TPA: FRG domain-containing protein [Acidobacteriota bacterium]|nr:FRG domain-containing protein [Acidobacteriota bacterium]